MHRNERTLRALFDRVWNSGDLDAIDELVAESYTVHSDPGDPWDGQTLTRDGFKERTAISKAPFPDLKFEVGIMVPGDEHVAVSWVMRGTNTGALGELPATNRPIEAKGLTIYHFEDGLISGHTQVSDRLAVMMQLGLLS